MKLYIKFNKEHFDSLPIDSLPTDFLHLQAKLLDVRIISQSEYIDIVEYEIENELNSNDENHLNFNDNIISYSKNINTILSDVDIQNICEKYVVERIIIDENWDKNWDFALTDSDTFFDFEKINPGLKLIEFCYEGDDDKNFMPATFYRIVK